MSAPLTMIAALFFCNAIALNLNDQLPTPDYLLCRHVYHDMINTFENYEDYLSYYEENIESIMPELHYDINTYLVSNKSAWYFIESYFDEDFVNGHQD